MDAVHKWGYTPYLLNREPVVVETDIRVTFELDLEVYCASRHLHDCAKIPASDLTTARAANGSPATNAICRAWSRDDVARGLIVGDAFFDPGHEISARVA
jgi:hypothetical protein